MLVLVLLAAGLLVGVDRLAAVAAGWVTAGQLQGQLGTPQRPSVDFGGFPFVTQLARGRYSSVHVVADDLAVPVADRDPVAVAHADMTMHDVVTQNRFATITAGTADGTFLMTYDSLSDLTGFTVESAGEGAVRIRFDVPIGNSQVSGTATGRPVLDADARRLTFEDASVSLTSEDGDSALADAAGRLVLGPIPLDSLPYDLRLTAVEVRDDGVVVSGTGTDIPLRG